MYDSFSPFSSDSTCTRSQFAGAGPLALRSVETVAAAAAVEALDSPVVVVDSIEAVEGGLAAEGDKVRESKPSRVYWGRFDVGDTVRTAQRSCQ